MKNNIDNYKFRASTMPKLMSKSGKWTLTNLAVLTEIAIQEKYGMKKVIDSDAMRKGTIVESDVMDLYEQVTGEKLFKNQKSMENSYFKGTHDSDKDDAKIDIKSAFDIWTFTNVTEKSAYDTYFWQLATYCYLDQKFKSILIYGLVDTPEEIKFDMYRKLAYSMPENEAEDIVNKNHTYSQIPPEKRLKVYEWEVTPQHFAQLEVRAIEGRQKLKEIYEMI